MESVGFARSGGAYEERIRELLHHGIALWDVLAQCERPGSLDSAIRPASEIANDIQGLLRDHPSIRRILLNGGKAEQAFSRHIRRALDDTLLQRLLVSRVPSTSPAHAVPFPEKLEAWQRAIVKESSPGGRGSLRLWPSLPPPSESNRSHGGTQQGPVRSHHPRMLDPRMPGPTGPCPQK